MGLMFTDGLVASELTEYGICAGEGVLTATGVPTAETKGPPTGCPTVGAPYIPTPNDPIGG